MNTHLTFEELMRSPINYVYGYYLMASYLYYVRYVDSPFTDPEFDQLCKRLLTEWDDVTHKNKNLSSPELLKAGTGYSIQAWEYPGGLRWCADRWKEAYDKRGEE